MLLVELAVITPVSSGVDECLKLTINRTMFLVCSELSRKSFIRSRAILSIGFQIALANFRETVAYVWFVQSKNVLLHALIKKPHYHAILLQIIVQNPNRGVVSVKFCFAQKSSVGMNRVQ
jgi:hypothetical protein